VVVVVAGLVVVAAAVRPLDPEGRHPASPAISSVAATSIEATRSGILGAMLVGGGVGAMGRA